MRPITYSSIITVIFLGTLTVYQPAYAVLNSPINAGCYLAAPGQCLLHLDPFAIYVSKGTRLAGFKLEANTKGVTGRGIYQFATDISNPPSGSYAPSPPRSDFAVQCGNRYTVMLMARDSGDADYQQVGTTQSITCPDGTGWLVWVPQVITTGAILTDNGSLEMTGAVNAQGGATQVRFQYGRTSAYGDEIDATPTGFEDAVNHKVSATASGLETNVTYHYRIVAENSAGIAYGVDKEVRGKGASPCLVPIYLLLLRSEEDG